jgi:hypothetical protein
MVKYCTCLPTVCRPAVGRLSTRYPPRRAGQILSRNTVEIDRASLPAGGRLGEIVSDTYTTYLTEPALAGISTAFHFNYFT